MASRELKIVRIGNSRGIRLPADVLARYQLGNRVVLEERSDGILLRAPGPAPSKLTWEETARAMALAREDWSDWDAVLADGLHGIPWEALPGRRVAEGETRYRAKRSRRK